MTLAERIVAARTAKGWTQNHLARVAEVNQPTLQRIEKPRRANMQPTIGTVGRLARALGMTVDELIDGTDVLTLSDAPVAGDTEAPRELRDLTPKEIESLEAVAKVGAALKLLAEEMKEQRARLEALEQVPVPQARRRRAKRSA